MALVLRACVCVSRNRCFQEFALRGQTVTIYRYTSNISKKFASIAQYGASRIVNNDGSEWEQVYRGKLNSTIFTVKLASLSTSIFALAAQPFLLMRAMETDNMPTMVGLAGMILFALMSPFLLHLVAKRYVIEIYYNAKTNTYLAKRYSLFLNKQELKFTPDDVHVPKLFGMLTTCTIKGIPMFFDEMDFRDMEHYDNIMGDHKPITFE